MATKLKTYPGQDIDVTWDGRLCIHIGECGRANNDLFVTGRDPWCAPDEVAAADARDVVERCPSGALAYSAKNGGATEAAPDGNRVFVANHGPLYLRGDLDIEGAGDDQPGLTRRAALCRCGQSKNKPFCDNSHEAAGFADRGAVGATGPGSTASGKLSVTLANNGPLLLDGPVTIVSAGGVPTFRGDKAALCRCGQSKNKPFCDGSHKAAGFRST